MKTVELLERGMPEAEGIASEAIKAFLDEAEESIHCLHSFMLLRHGRVIAEGYWRPYQAEDPHILYSLSKSFTSTAVGFAVAEGKLNLEDPVLAFFPDAKPAHISNNLELMQVKHLLTMTSGHNEDTMQALRISAERPDNNWVQAFLAQPVEHKPGTHFVYNTGATYMLSAIVQQVTGLTLLDYLQPLLFASLGFEQPTWESSPQGINTGGFGLSLTTAEIARFGQLYLQKGMWQGKRILPQNWVEAATMRQISNGSGQESDWEQGYGYQFWCCRHGAYRGDGAFGQFCLVLPEQEAVLVITGGIQQGMQDVLNLVWKHILPAMKTAPLSIDPDKQQELAQKIEQLKLPLVKGKPQTSKIAQISGKKYGFEENTTKIKTITLDFENESCILTLEDDHGQHKIECVHGAWRLGTTTLGRQGMRRVGACSGWTSEDTFAISLYFRTPTLSNPALLGTVLIPFGLLITFNFVENRITVALQPDVSFAPLKPTILEGRLA